MGRPCRTRSSARLTALLRGPSLMLIAVLLASCEAATPLSPPPGEGEEFSVGEVVDGDTIRLTDGRTVRYLGINAPEVGQPYFDEATAANRRLVSGRRARIVLDVQPTDRYGRLLAYVWVGSRFVNLELVRQGYANAYTEPPNVRYSAEILAAEREARSAGVGLWKPSNIRLRIRDIHYDAPGADHLNPNGEWVELTNEGSKAVGLKGFRLKDEASHLYTFRDVRLPPGETLRIYSGKGVDLGLELYWGLTDDAVWTNTGDTAYLWDSEGRLVDTYHYP